MPTLAAQFRANEVEMANAPRVFGSIDFNRGDPQNGWDTDQFPFESAENTWRLYIFKKGRLKNGAQTRCKVRRKARLKDLFYAEIGDDLLARDLTTCGRDDLSLITQAIQMMNAIDGRRNG